MQVQVAIYGLHCIDLNNDTLKILGTHFSYNEKLKEEKNSITDCNRYSISIKIWKMRNLILEGKIVTFKTVVIFQPFITTVPKHIINELKKTQKAFLWKHSTPKIKDETLCRDYKAGGLKNIDISNKIIALQCSWIRTLCDNSFHEWKLILLYLIQKSFSRSFTFYQNLLFKSNKTKFIPSFYQ